MRGHLGVVGAERTGCGRAGHRREHEPRVVGEVLDERGRAVQAVGREARLLGQRLGAVPHGVALRSASTERDLLERPQPGPELHVHAAAVRRHHHEQRVGQVRGDPAQRARARSRPRAPARCRPAGGSERRRGSASSCGSTCRRRSRPPRASATDRPRSAASRAMPAPVMPPPTTRRDRARRREGRRGRRRVPRATAPPCAASAQRVGAELGERACASATLSARPCCLGDLEGAARRMRRASSRLPRSSHDARERDARRHRRCRRA